MRGPTNQIVADAKASAFFAFSEPWEDCDDAIDPTARFRLAEMNKHMAIRDFSEEEGEGGNEDYRIAVD